MSAAVQTKNPLLQTASQKNLRAVIYGLKRLSKIRAFSDTMTCIEIVADSAGECLAAAYPSHNHTATATRTLEDWIGMDADSDVTGSAIAEFLRETVGDAVDQAANSCPICLEPLDWRTQGKAFLLSCGHEFCHECLATYTVLSRITLVSRPCAAPRPLALGSCCEGSCRGDFFHRRWGSRWRGSRLRALSSTTRR